MKMMMRTKVKLVAACMATAVVLGVGMPAAIKLAAQEKPAEAEETFVGFRGNGTGRFPDASPPIEWGKVSEVMAGLRCQAEKPEDDKPGGVPAYHGSLTRWLVLGPLPSKGGKDAIDEEFVEDEANWQPAEGEKIKEVAWKKTETSGNILDFSALYGKGVPHPYRDSIYYEVPYAAYGHTYIYSAREGTVHVSFSAIKTAKMWINGVALVSAKKKSVWTVKLKKGWNRLLCKAVNLADAKPTKYGRSQMNYWSINLGLMAVYPYETETKNIVWATRLPGWSVASPVIVGDRIFAMCEPGDLICINKKDGKIKWLRSNNCYDTLTEEEKNSNPEYKEFHPVAARIKEINDSFAAGKLPEQAVMKERADLYRKIDKIFALVRKADPEKYKDFRIPTPRVLGRRCVPTPVSDGEGIYIWMNTCIVAKYDLDGNRKWIMIEAIQMQEHGHNISPILVGGKLIIVAAKGPTKTDLTITAFDCGTGKILWRTSAPRSNTQATPVSFKVQEQDFIYDHGFIIRVADGKLVSDAGGSTSTSSSSIPTPVIADRTLYDLKSRKGGLRIAELPSSTDNMALTGVGHVKFYEKSQTGWVRWMIGSPLVHDGLLYTVNDDGILYVVDTKAQAILYQRDLGMGKLMSLAKKVHSNSGIVNASLVLAGEHIYVLGMSGTTVVFRPGRTYQEVARNKIEDITNARRLQPEIFPTAPVPDGKHLYVKSDKYLYCIGETEEAEEAGVKPD